MGLSVAIVHPENVLGCGEHQGFQWAVVHNNMGHRCGYVRIPVGHSWHGKDYDDVSANCHGGFTFSEEDVPCDEVGEDNAWWLGFDCAHGGDAPDPSLIREPDKLGMLGSFGEVRTQEYVESECRSLCEQAKEAAL